MDTAQPNADPPVPGLSAAQSTSVRWAAASRWAAAEAADLVAASKKRRRRGLMVSAVFASVLALMVIFWWSTADTFSRIWMVVMICQTGWFVLTDLRPSLIERRLPGVVRDESGRPANAPAIQVLLEYSDLDDDVEAGRGPLKWYIRNKNQQKMHRTLTAIIKEGDGISSQH